MSKTVSNLINEELDKILLQEFNIQADVMALRQMIAFTRRMAMAQQRGANPEIIPGINELVMAKLKDYVKVVRSQLDARKEVDRAKAAAAAPPPKPQEAPVKPPQGQSGPPAGPPAGQTQPDASKAAGEPAAKAAETAKTAAPAAPTAKTAAPEAAAKAEAAKTAAPAAPAAAPKTAVEPGSPDFRYYKGKNWLSLAQMDAAAKAPGCDAACRKKLWDQQPTKAEFAAVDHKKQSWDGKQYSMPQKDRGDWEDWLKNGPKVQESIQHLIQQELEKLLTESKTRRRIS